MPVASLFLFLPFAVCACGGTVDARKARIFICYSCVLHTEYYSCVSRRRVLAWCKGGVLIGGWANFVASVVPGQDGPTLRTRWNGARRDSDNSN